MKKALWNVTILAAILAGMWALIGGVCCLRNGAGAPQWGGAVYGLGFAGCGALYIAVVVVLAAAYTAKRLFGGPDYLRGAALKRGRVKFLWQKVTGKYPDEYDTSWNGAWRCETTASLPKEFADELMSLHGVVDARCKTDYGFLVRFAAAFDPQVMRERVMSCVVRNGESG